MDEVLSSCSGVFRPLATIWGSLRAPGQTTYQARSTKRDPTSVLTSTPEISTLFHSFGSAKPVGNYLETALRPSLLRAGTERVCILLPA